LKEGKIRKDIEIQREKERIIERQLEEQRLERERERKRQIEKQKTKKKRFKIIPELNNLIAVSLGVLSNICVKRLNKLPLNSASISYSVTPGLVKFKTRLNPFSVISQASCKAYNSSGSFCIRKSLKIGARRLIVCEG
jgi:hypothetical protein